MHDPKCILLWINFLRLSELQLPYKYSGCAKVSIQAKWALRSSPWGNLANFRSSLCSEGVSPTPAVCGRKTETHRPRGNKTGGTHPSWHGRIQVAVQNYSEDIPPFELTFLGHHIRQSQVVSCSVLPGARRYPLMLVPTTGSNFEG